MAHAPREKLAAREIEYTTRNGLNLREMIFFL